MTIPLVDLQAQYRTIQPDIDAALLGVVRRGDFILGAAVKEFEQAFARFIGTRHCVGVASGTDALFLTLRALGIGAGDKVLVPANTFIATALAVSYAGATPVLCDVDPESCTLDVAAARKDLPAGLKAIVPVHLYGQPANMEAVLDLANAKGLLVIEDAAQAHGAVHTKGRAGRSAGPPASASTRARTWAPTAMAAPFAPMTTPWPTTCGCCATGDPP